MKKDVKAILNYKDSCNMYVINSYRKKKQYGIEFFPNQFDHVDFGLIPNADFQNLRFEIDFFNYQVSGNHPLLFFNGKIASSGIGFQISSVGLFNIFLYNGTGVSVGNTDLVSGWNKAIVNYTENGVEAIVNGITDNFTYQPLVLATTGARTNMGRIHDFNNSSYDTEAIISKCNIYELDINANILSTILECDFVGSGTTLPDLSGNGNNGTFVNNPAWVEL